MPEPADSLARRLARWAHDLDPAEEDLALADRSLVDTVAVALAGRDHRVTRLAEIMPEGPRWAVAAHVLDFDDLHMESTTHISAVCVPTALALGAGARAYLAGAGVMARLGHALGWPHYSAGWHATCTAGAPAAAAGAAVAMGLGPDQIANAIALAVPGAGGVQRAFGTDAKSLQVGFAVDTGIRAATLAAAGAQADPLALEEWMTLVGGDPGAADLSGPAVPGGLAVKIYPCCYALQRPISALGELAQSGRGPGRGEPDRAPHPRGHAGPADPSPARYRAAGQVQPGVRRRRRAARRLPRLRQLHRRRGAQARRPPPGRAGGDQERAGRDLAARRRTGRRAAHGQWRRGPDHASSSRPDRRDGPPPPASSRPRSPTAWPGWIRAARNWIPPRGPGRVPPTCSGTSASAAPGGEARPDKPGGEARPDKPAAKLAASGDGEPWMS